MFWGNSWFKNPTNWLVECILTYISVTRFFKYRIRAGTQEIIWIFVIENIQWKLITNFFFKFKTTLFLAHFPNFWNKKVFYKNFGSVTHNITRVSCNMPKLREISCSNSQKTLGQMTGRKNRQTLSHRILPVTAGGLTSTFAVDWHLKVKDIEKVANITKNYCITVRMQNNQLNSYTHSADFRVS